ncbi:MAG: hypothetical protein L0I37_11030 [Lactococcus lactis]|nr:hypothetical protein [Lactococcus lactis]
MFGLYARYNVDASTSVVLAKATPVNPNATTKPTIHLPKRLIFILKSPS